MKVVQVSRAQQMAAELLIEILERDGEPVRDWTRRVAAARPRPAEGAEDVETPDGVVLYLV